MSSRIILMALFIAASIGNVNAMSFANNGGHKNDLIAVFEGVEGMDELYKLVSSGIDNEFAIMFRKEFGSIPGNHRIVGHWGMGGDIPFHQEPWKTAFEKGGYDTKKIGELWKQYRNSLTDRAIEILGKDIPRTQAASIVALIYDVHLLGDLTMGNKRTDLVLKVNLIQDDILKMLEKIYGKKSPIVASVRTQFAEISKYCPHALRAQKILQVLSTTPLGKNFVAIYGRYFPVDSKGNKLIQYSAEQASKALRLAAEKFAKLNGLWAELCKNGNIKAANQVLNSISKSSDKFITGCLQSVATKKGKQALILSIPVETHLKGINAGTKAGVLTFVLTEGFVICKFANGTMTQTAFAQETAKSCLEGLANGTVGYVGVLLGWNPAGLLVLSITIGATFAVDIIYDFAIDAATTPPVTIDDLLGTFPTELQNRPDAWEPIQKESPFAPDKTTPFAPEEITNPSIFEPTPKSKEVF